MSLIRQTSTYMVAHGASALLGFLSVILFTRLLSPADYGFYVVVLGIAGIVSALLFSWVRLSVMRFEAEGGKADIRMTALAAYGATALTLPAALAVTVFAAGVPFDRAAAAVALAAALGLFELGQEILRARLDAGSYARAAVFRALVAIGASMALIDAGYGGFGLVLGVGAAYLATALTSAHRVWRGPRRPFETATLHLMLRFGLPMALSGGIMALHGALDRLMVAYLLGDSAAGVYGASADLVRQIILFPALAVASAVVPMAIRSLTEEGVAAADAHLTKSGELLLAVVLPTVVGLALVAPHVAALILGPDFRDTAAELIPILVFAWLFHAITQQFVQVSFHLAKKPALMVAHGVIILSANAAAMVALVPLHGLSGAAWALVLAEAVGVAAGFALARFAHPLPFAWRPVARVVLAVAVMAVPTALMERADLVEGFAGLVLSVATGVAIYAAAGFALDICGIRSALAGRLRAGVPASRSC